MGGTFQTDREIFDNPIWQNVTEFRLFLYLVGNAVWKEEGVRIGDITVHRGQFLRSYRNLQKDLEYLENNTYKQYSISTIKRTIDKLVENRRISVSQLKLGTLFTIANYEYYQGFDRMKKERLETALEHPRNNKKKDNNILYIFIEAYSENEILRQSLKEFINMRDKIKKPLTENALKILLKKLDNLTKNDDEKIKILEESILHNWQSVYPLKAETVDKPVNKPVDKVCKTSKPNKFHNFESKMQNYSESELEEKIKKNLKNRKVEGETK